MTELQTSCVVKGFVSITKSRPWAVGSADTDTILSASLGDTYTWNKSSDDDDDDTFRWKYTRFGIVETCKSIVVDIGS